MSDTSTNETFKLNIKNNSSYADDKVFVHISGKNTDKTAWYYLANTTSPTMTEFDDTASTLLKRKISGAFVGNQKYFLKLSDLTKVKGEDHTYSIQVPRIHLTSGRIYLSFGESLPGIGILAPGYAYAVDSNGNQTGDGTPVTPSSALTATAKVGNLNSSGQREITNLSIDTSTQVYINEPVKIAGIATGTQIASVSSTSEFLLAADIIGSSLQVGDSITLNFTPGDIDKLSMQGPSFSGSPDYQIPFEFMELSATIDKTVQNPYYTLFANTSVVDFFSIGLGMTVTFSDNTSQSVGFEKDIRSQVFTEFNDLGDGQKGFQGFVMTDGSISYSAKVADTTKILRVLGPQQIIQLQPSGDLANYLDAPINNAWSQYINKKEVREPNGSKKEVLETSLNIPDNLPGHTPYGFTYAGQTIDYSAGEQDKLVLKCTAVPTGETGLDEEYQLPKPTTDIVFKCDDTNPPPNSYSNNGKSAHKRIGSLILAAINRGVFDDYNDWSNHKDAKTNGAATFYQRTDKKFNVYSDILHKYALNNKVYGFGYDDIYGQDPTIAGPIGKRQDGGDPPGDAITSVTVIIPNF